MGERSERLQALSVTEIVLEFRRALVAIHPSLERLDLMADGDGYDDSDEIEGFLWKILVVGSLQWRFGLDEPPTLPPYGFTQVGPAPGAMNVILHDGRSGRFVEFACDRQHGGAPYGVVSFEPSGVDGIEMASVSDIAEFVWVKSIDE